MDVPGACFLRRWNLDGSWQRVLVIPRMATGRQEGRDPEPSAAIMDSQSVRIREEPGSNQGYDAAKCVPGRNSHLLVDTSGLLLAGRVTPANISVTAGRESDRAALSAPPLGSCTSSLSSSPSEPSG